jgi:hypothetical protein
VVQIREIRNVHRILVKKFLGMGQLGRPEEDERL